MEGLAQLEILCERLYNSQDSVERAHAERTLNCFSVNTDYISQCQYILDNALTPYALMLASSSLLKQVTEQSLPLQLRLDIRNILVCLQIFMHSYFLEEISRTGFYPLGEIFLVSLLYYFYKVMMSGTSASASFITLFGNINL
jgi:hypothetical protein